jgi:hypothetical protein
VPAFGTPASCSCAASSFLFLRCWHSPLTCVALRQQNCTTTGIQEPMPTAIAMNEHRRNDHHPPHTVHSYLHSGTHTHIHIHGQARAQHEGPDCLSLDVGVEAAEVSTQFLLHPLTPHTAHRLPRAARPSPRGCLVSLHYVRGLTFFKHHTSEVVLLACNCGQIVKLPARRDHSGLCVHIIVTRSLLGGSKAQGPQDTGTAWQQGQRKLTDMSHNLHECAKALSTGAGTCRC